MLLPLPHPPHLPPEIVYTGSVRAPGSNAAPLVLRLHSRLCSPDLCNYLYATFCFCFVFLETKMLRDIYQVYLKKKVETIETTS